MSKSIYTEHLSSFLDCTGRLVLPDPIEQLRESQQQIMSETSSAKPAAASYGTMEDVHPNNIDNTEHPGVPEDEERDRSSFRTYTTFAALCVSAFGTLHLPFPQDCALFRLSIADSF